METPLDAAHSRMQAAADDESARRLFFAAIATAELFLVLEEEPAAGTIRPLVLTTEDGPLVLAFDTEERLANFIKAEAHFAALTGRRIAALLAPQGIALGLNLDVAPSSSLLPVQVLAWIAETASVRSEERVDAIKRITPPTAATPELLRILDSRLPAFAGLCETAFLAGAEYEDGTCATLLAFIDMPEPLHEGASAAIAEAVGLAGLGDTTLDVVFAHTDAALVPRLEAVAMRFDLPELKQSSSAAPGTDPKRPPKLR